MLGRVPCCGYLVPTMRFSSVAAVADLALSGCGSRRAGGSGGAEEASAHVVEAVAMPSGDGACGETAGVGVSP